ncbi:MAG: flavin reductase family protein [Pseudomonadota bacterium]|nr:flavin reductase [Gammaproteobacteria bacterium]MEE2683670.1 flavin reductase family protein [Pseudomonadota bacterium]|tara:strand:+ start:3221 stop:3832 length:612 start_codon:yes stop_codon:yes gene_type:complete
MFYKPQDGHGLTRNPLQACVVPRPIGWISTLSRSGLINLAPFSHFNLVSISPPIVMYSCSGFHLDGDIKDSALNAKETGEFVYNMATWDTREAMNMSSKSLKREEDEFYYSKLTRTDSEIVKAPRVLESPINLECKTWKCIELPKAPDNSKNILVLGEVVGVHIKDEVIKDGFVDTVKIKPLARLGYKEYTVVDNSFSMDRPK